jgi:pSer/pThr/pTyr-binding forkhead associated (FHA) protein/sugar lactone lactonase YvrE
VVAEPQLRLVEGPEAGRTVPLTASVALGRDRTCDVVIDDEEMSRRHARVVVDDGKVTVVDLGSLNGTFVNGERITGPRRLEPGDLVTLGTTVMEFLPAGSGPGFTRVREVRPAPTVARELRVVEGATAARALAIDGSHVLGRDPKCDLAFDDEEISWRHARVTTTGGRVTIEDLDSTNGTFVNGRRVVERHELEPGARIELGDAVLEFLAPSPAATGAPPAAPPGDGAFAGPPGLGPKVVAILACAAVVGAGALVYGLTGSATHRACPPPRSIAGVGGIALAPDGGLWGAEGRGDRIARFDVRTHRVVEHPTPAGTQPNDVALAPDGAIWFTGGSGRVGRLDPRTGRTTFLAGISAGSRPAALAWARDGNLYWSDQRGGRLGRYDPRSQSITESAYNLPPGNRIAGVSPTPDGGLWWALEGADRLAHFDLAGQRFDSFVALPARSGPREVDYAPATRSLYATLPSSNRIARHDVASGQTSFLPVPFAPPSARVLGGSLLRYERRGGAGAACGGGAPAATLVFATDTGQTWVSRV